MLSKAWTFASYPFSRPSALCWGFSCLHQSPLISRQIEKKKWIHGRKLHACTHSRSHFSMFHLCKIFEMWELITLPPTLAANPSTRSSFSTAKKGIAWLRRKWRSWDKKKALRSLFGADCCYPVCTWGEIVTEKSARLECRRLALIHLLPGLV